MPHYVVATTKPAEFTRARQLLEWFGTVERTDFYNILLVIVDDIGRFIAAYVERMAEDPSSCLALARREMAAVPAAVARA